MEEVVGVSGAPSRKAKWTSLTGVSAFGGIRGIRCSVGSGGWR